MSIVSVIIKNNFREKLIFVGFYIVNEDRNRLEIGPYASDILPTPLIEYGKGQCGSCWESAEIQIQTNVNQCSNYIPCDSLTNSEIVLPFYDHFQKVIAVLDIDSPILSYFDSHDSSYL